MHPGSALKEVNVQWTWFTDYAYSTATWTLNAPDGRRLEVGMGIKAFGKPLGEHRKFQRHVVFTTVGIGSIHVRVLDGKGPCTVQLDQGDAGVIPVYPPPKLPTAPPAGRPHGDRRR